jgi:hypothetical protein
VTAAELLERQRARGEPSRLTTDALEDWLRQLVHAGLVLEGLEGPLAASGCPRKGRRPIPSIVDAEQEEDDDDE